MLPEYYFCPNCGKEIHRRWNRCPGCDSDLKGYRAEEVP